jgi:hypothetical protein
MGFQVYIRGVLTAVEGLAEAVLPFVARELDTQFDREAAKLLPAADAAVVDAIVAAEVAKVEKVLAADLAPPAVPPIVIVVPPVVVEPAKS